MGDPTQEPLATGYQLEPWMIRVDVMLQAHGA
jgi:hypothetical protein